MAEKPLMLKDYLEIESIAESFRWPRAQRAGPVGGSGTTVRRLLEADLCLTGDGYSGWSLVRYRSKGVFSKLSAVIRILQFCTDESLSPISASGGGGASRVLTRSISKKLRRGLWKKCGPDKEEGKATVNDKVRLRSPDEEEIESCYFYSSPGVCICSSSSDSTSSRSISDLSVNRSDESKPRSSESQSPRKETFPAGVADGNRREQEQELQDKDMDCPSEEEKEQLSPVSVMDFPYRDEDEDGEVEQPSAPSPCFEQSIENIERTKNQLLQRIRRLESLASLDALDLDHLFSRTETHAESSVHVATKEEQWQRRASSLLRNLNAGESLTGCGEKLLFDFFVEGLSFNWDCRTGTADAGACSEEELLLAAIAWSAGSRTMAEHGVGLGVAELEMGGGGWKRFKEEEEMVAVAISGGMLTWLVSELVADLMSAA